MLFCQSQSRTGGPQWICVWNWCLFSVADVDRAKALYVDQVGFRVEQALQADEAHRFVELMPPGSSARSPSRQAYIDSEPGSLKGVQLNGENVDEVHAFPRDPDAAVSETHDYPRGRFCFLSDPDGNG